MLLLSDDAENETGEESDEDEDDEDDEDDTEVKEENGVLVLTDGNFDTFMEGKDTVLLEFYAPWYVCDSSGFSLDCNLLRCFLQSINLPFVCPFEGVATANSLYLSMRKSHRA